MSQSRNRVLALAFIVSAASAATIIACSGDDSSPVTSTPDAGTLTDARVTPSKDVVQPDAPIQPTGVPPGCFSGTPTTNAELINACTESQYVVIDNCARIGLCDGGALPARVPPPVDAGTDAAADARADAADAGSSSDASDASDDATTDASDAAGD
jgi:hypothetical protein